MYERSPLPSSGNLSHFPEDGRGHQRGGIARRLRLDRHTPMRHRLLWLACLGTAASGMQRVALHSHLRHSLAASSLRSVHTAAPFFSRCRVARQRLRMGAPAAQSEAQVSTASGRTYDHGTIEPKWQQRWEDESTFAARRREGKEKKYVLDMFPYPSGAGLHVGHPEGYTASDIMARYWRMCDYDVLHPMGWDAFGLPAEQHAINTGTHPEQTTKDNIANFKRQCVLPSPLQHLARRTRVLPSDRHTPPSAWQAALSRLLVRLVT